MDAAGGRLDDDSPRFLAALAAAGLVDDAEWDRIGAAVTEAVRFLRAPRPAVVHTEEGALVFDLDADPRNADWIRISAAQRRAGRVLPFWGALFVWRTHHDDEDAFWERVGAVAAALGYPRRARG